MQHTPASNKFAHNALNYYCLIAIILLCSGCYYSQKAGTKKVQQIALARDLGIAQLNGQLQKAYDSVIVYYFQKYILCQLPNHYSESIVQVVDANEEEGQLIDSVTLEEIRYNYFIYKKDKPFGYLYTNSSDKNWQKIITDTINPALWKKLPIDSILTARVMKGTDFTPISQKTKLYKTITDTGTGDIKKVYVPEALIDDTVNDTTFMYFTKQLKNIPFSFSPTLDSTTGLKLYQVRMQYNQRYSEQYKVMAPAREYRFTMRELKVKNEAELARFFDRFQRSPLRF